MGGTFGGKPDKYATNDVLNGQVVATGTPGSTTVRDPNMGLDPNQMRNRKLARAGGDMFSGVMRSMDGPTDQPSAPTNFNFANNQPGYVQPQNPAMTDYTKKPPNPFFGRGY